MRVFFFSLTCKFTYQNLRFFRIPLYESHLETTLNLLHTLDINPIPMLYFPCNLSRGNFRSSYIVNLSPSGSSKVTRLCALSSSGEIHTLGLANWVARRPFDQRVVLRFPGVTPVEMLKRPFFSRAGGIRGGKQTNSGVEVSVPRLFQGVLRSRLPRVL